jgi:preprotein translocase subunit SecA
MQQIAEGLNLELRLFLRKYESAVEGQRLNWQSIRQKILTSDDPRRVFYLRAMDDLWSRHLASIAELKSGIHWVSWGGRDPLFEFLSRIHQWYKELCDSDIGEAEFSGADPTERGAVWTYMTTDQPFGTWDERIARGIRRKISGLRR